MDEQPTAQRGGRRVEVDAFVGRRQELARVRRLLRSARLVTLTGVGGCGKTRLALRVAGDLAGGFPCSPWRPCRCPTATPG